MSKRINLIPMAGAGQRFADVGYTLPKPLIPVAGKPMIVHAAESLPKADKWIFVCRAQHLAEAPLERELKKSFQPAEIISVDKLTEGQACTCLLAKDRLEPDAMLTIGACDNAMTYNADAFASSLASPDTDAIIWTFRNNPAVLQDPRMYGWVDVDEKGRVRRVSVKVPISDQPMKDHAIIGAFTFKRAKDFVSAAEAMIRADRRIRGEFYVDEVMNVAVEQGLRVSVFEVNRYICWGTPRDLETYNYWRGYFGEAGL